MPQVRSAPNVLTCGCQLGPTWKYCQEAVRLMAQKHASYKRVVGAPLGTRERLRMGNLYEIDRKALDRHFAEITQEVAHI